jgi:hypothetical protein
MASIPADFRRRVKALRIGASSSMIAILIGANTGASAFNSFSTLCICLHRQLELQGCPAVGIALYPHLAAMALDN